MNEIKLVHGAAGNRTFATPAKQTELKQLDDQRKQERTDRLVNDWNIRSRAVFNRCYCIRCNLGLMR